MDGIVFDLLFRPRSDSTRESRVLLRGRMVGVPLRWGANVPFSVAVLSIALLSAEGNTASISRCRADTDEALARHIAKIINVCVKRDITMLSFAFCLRTNEATRLSDHSEGTTLTIGTDGTENAEKPLHPDVQANCRPVERYNRKTLRWMLAKKPHQKGCVWPAFNRSPIADGKISCDSIRG